MKLLDISPGYYSDLALREAYNRITSELDSAPTNAAIVNTADRSGLELRFRQIQAEVELRGLSPIRPSEDILLPPSLLVQTNLSPIAQLSSVNALYTLTDSYRIPPPQNAQQLWAQHKYSVMARNQQLYKTMGQNVSTMRKGADYTQVFQVLSEQLYHAPTRGGIRNALDHMWGYVSKHAPHLRPKVQTWPNLQLISSIQNLAKQHNTTYLLESTALSDLAIWSSP